MQIIKFVGCYHGHADSFLVKAGSGVATLGLPDSPGKFCNERVQRQYAYLVVHSQQQQPEASKEYLRTNLGADDWARLRHALAATERAYFTG